MCGGHRAQYRALGLGAGRPRQHGVLPLLRGHVRHDELQGDGLRHRQLGHVYITSTGKVGNVTRTIEVGVRQADFLSNLYLSNYNLVDPIMEADSGRNVVSQRPGLRGLRLGGQRGRPERLRTAPGGC